MATSTSPQDRDIGTELCERVRQANAAGTALRIVGGDTKAFYGRPVEGETLSTREHRGITGYDPVELIVSVRAGTPLAQLEAALAENGQMLPFEPPHFGAAATVGGTVAAGLSGPRRPWAGAVRDFVLGARVITHTGEEQRFGGEVMKNVAGYDLSRLMVGAQGGLGLLTEVTLKVLPRPSARHGLRLEMPLDEARERLAEWGRQPLPLTAAAWQDGALHLRLEGGPGSVAATRERLGGEDLDPGFWDDLREQRLPLFAGDDERPLWRISLPQRARLEADGLDEQAMLHDWAGAQRWLRTELPAESLREACAAAGGHATCLTPGAAEPFTPLPEVMFKYHRRLKAELDPKGIFNPGRLYAEL
ncbi:putative FAD-linked oxidoreductase [Halomonas sp. THAF12]|uniref:glycolate oxidase subunit GlcE n=1 Tax=Halomonas sp. THAF12 TaxID=2587849 RepID=UPI0012680F80|nr:glycolate oxidase subunit GlcE [Halomonas sp. THAF12]QFT83948.1 putative FAD-linked oxidoreductase [Halomonas sp. THAF12]